MAVWQRHVLIVVSRRFVLAPLRAADVWRLAARAVGGLQRESQGEHSAAALQKISYDYTGPQHSIYRDRRDLRYSIGNSMIRSLRKLIIGGALQQRSASSRYWQWKTECIWLSERSQCCLYRILNAYASCQGNGL